MNLGPQTRTSEASGTPTICLKQFAHLDDPDDCGSL